MFIGGAWADDDRTPRIERYNPASGELVATYVRGDTADIARAVEAARAALASDAWANIAPRQRTELLLAAAAGFLASEHELAEVEAAETGKPLRQAREEIRAGAELWKYAASALRTLHGEIYPALSRDHMGMTMLEPVGVVALILPWNFPFIVSAERLPFMLAAGCTVVAKPSEFAGGTSILSAEILKKAGIPDGVYNVVTGLGQEAGAALVEHPDVAMVSFTGSSENGRRVMAAASGSLKRVSLELGGKNPTVVFADADLEAAADAVVSGFTHNAGQCCIATSRLLVERPIAHRFERLLIDKLERMPDIQPVATRQQFEKVRRYVELGKRQEKLVYGGTLTDDGGCLRVGATVIAAAAKSCIVKDEIFGPVLSVHPFDSEAEAIALANDTVYGLAACIWTSDLGRALRVAKKVRCGRLWINAPQDNYPELPVGGYGASGIGREAGKSGLLTYSEIKSIVICAG
jgi:acyl-CoA reductase-like NAD-dependent aldehyde dehydrogenase